MTRCTMIASLVGSTMLGSAALADVSTYSNDFSSGGGNYWGAAGHTTYNGHGDLQLTSDYPGDYFGTWATGGLENTERIDSFSASFDFSFNNNNDGSWRSDGFSFVFGQLSDGMNDSGDWGHSNLANWNGGEWGLNNFSRLGSGMSVGFDTFGGDAGAYARWGKDTYAQNNMNENWLDHVTYYGYDYALYDQHQATMEIEWVRGGDLVAYLTTPDNAYGAGTGRTEILRTGAFGDIDTTGFEFGFAGRVGGATWDVLIDNLDIEYSYAPAPGAMALLGLAGLFGGRRRHR